MYDNYCCACRKLHAWRLVGSEYDEICGDCVREDPRVDFCPEEQRYALFAYCQCGDRGPVNYGGDDGLDYRFYCRGSQSSCRP